MFQIINKRLIIGLALSFSILLLAGPAVLAGGWAVVTLDQLPTEVVAGQPLKIGFMIRQHGRTPWVYNQVMVHATHVQSHEKISVQAQVKGVEGHYEATLKFPQAGTWRWGIEAGLMPEQQPMPDLVVLDTNSVKNVNAQTPLSDKKASLSAERGASSSVPLGVGVIGAVGTIGALLFWLRTRTSPALTLLTVTAVTSTVGFGLAANPATLAMFRAESERLEASPTQVAPTASAELGQALFVAKGCIVCHQHEAVNDIRQLHGFADFRVGPDLPTLATDPEVLHKWLKDPSAMKPQTEMPNLKLNETEIEALVAFLLNPTPNAEEAGIFPAQDDQPASSVTAKVELKPAELFFIRAQGAKGLLVAYDVANNVEYFRLPPGMPAADGSHYYAAAPQQNSTILEVFGPNTSHLERRFTLKGRWFLSGVSPTGRWLALTRLPSESEQQAWTQAKRWETEIQIIDATTGEVAHSMQLDGNFEVETVSAAGDALFLIEHLPAIKPTQYLIRLYDLSAERLQPDPLRAKTADDKLMTGLAWGGVASPNGRWLLTLYLNTSRNMAFIHALNLVDKFPVCIDLPSGDGDFEQLEYYSLTLDPAGRTVYAANATLGVVTEVSLDNFQVIRKSEFAASALTETTPEAEPEAPTNYR